jgi:hypothetical protein
MPATNAEAKAVLEGMAGMDTVLWEELRASDYNGESRAEQALKGQLPVRACPRRGPDRLKLIQNNQRYNA